MIDMTVVGEEEGYSRPRQRPIMGRVAIPAELLPRELQERWMNIRRMRREVNALEREFNEQIRLLLGRL